MDIILKNVCKFKDIPILKKFPLIEFGEKLFV